MSGIKIFIPEISVRLKLESETHSDIKKLPILSEAISLNKNTHNFQSSNHAFLNDRLKLLKKELKIKPSPN
jgi:hypothetical protein